MTRKEERRGLARIEDYVDTSIQGLNEYLEKSKDGLITATCNNNGNRDDFGKNRKTTNMKSRKEKQLCEHFKWKTKEIIYEMT